MELLIAVILYASAVFFWIPLLAATAQRSVLGDALGESPDARKSKVPAHGSSGSACRRRAAVFRWKSIPGSR